MKRTCFVCLFPCLITTFLWCQWNPLSPINRRTGIAPLVSTSQLNAKSRTRVLNQYGELPLSLERMSLEASSIFLGAPTYNLAVNFIGRSGNGAPSAGNHVWFDEGKVCVGQNCSVPVPPLNTDMLSRILVSSGGGSSSVVLAYEGAWTATANDSFLHISAGSGSGIGNGVVVFTYDPFTGTGTRTGTLTIAGFTVTVTQAGTNYMGPGQGTMLVSAGLNHPAGVAVDGSGNLYIADTLNGAIEEWNASTQQVTALISSGLNQPAGVAVDGSGNVYIADTLNSAIKEWNASTQQVTTLVSSGLNQPAGVAVDGSGNVYIADTLNSAIEEWNASTLEPRELGPGLVVA